MPCITVCREKSWDLGRKDVGKLAGEFRSQILRRCKFFLCLFREVLFASRRPSYARTAFMVVKIESLDH